MSPNYCFCGLNSDMLESYFHLVHNTFSFLFCFLLWLICYLEAYLFLNILVISTNLLVLISKVIAVREYTLYDWNTFKFIEILFCGKCTTSIWEECVFCCWVECSKNVNPIRLIDSVVQVFHIPADFLSACSINYWERDSEISDYNCLFLFAVLSLSASCIL